MDNQGKPQFHFGDTPIGKNLIKLLGSKRIGLGLTPKDFTVKFLSNMIPKKNFKTGAYFPPSVKSIQEGLEKINEYVVQNNIDLVLTFGATVRNKIVGSSSSAYKLDEHTFKYNEQEHTARVACYPALQNPSSYTANEKNNILILTRLARRYLAGDTELKPILGKYEYVNSFDRVKDIFENVLPKYPIIAVDFETNALQTYRDGAKALCVSLSWKEGQGVTIPMYHKDEHCFTEEQKAKIVEYIKELLEREQPKVFHNANYDIAMLMNIYGVEHVTNVYDTLIMYYICTDESPTTSKTLKHLASVYTDMTDYEQDRDIALTKYLNDDKKHWIEEQEKQGKKVRVSQYKPPVNEIDGGSSDFEWLPMDILAPYASADTDATLRLYHIFKKKIDKNKQWKKLAYFFYPKLLDTLTYMESTGIQLDRDKAHEYQEAYSKMLNDTMDTIYKTTPEIKELEQQRLDMIEQRAQLMASVKPADRTDEQKRFIKEAGKYAGNKDGVPKYKVNLSSKKDLQKIFIDILGYKLPLDKEFIVPRYAHKQLNPDDIDSSYFKMDKTVLNYIAKEYNSDLAKSLLQYSELQKAKTAFVDTLPTLADSKGRIHTTFNITGTSTGRLSSSNPNLQQQIKPSHNWNDPTYAYPIKGLYKSRFKGGVLANIDFKSLEVFVATLIGRDKGMTKALMEGADIHKRNASIAFGVPTEEVTGTMRQRAKSATFGTLYGQSAMAFAQMWDETEEEAQKTVDNILNAMPGVRKSIDLIHAFVERYGYTQTLQGNYRRLPNAKNKKNLSLYSRAIRQSYNAVVQGSGSYFTNTSLILIREYLREHNLKSKIAITVHDSILLDVHPDEVEEVIGYAKYIMENLPIKYLMCRYSDFGLTPQEIPEKYRTSNENYFRFPLFAEVEIGRNYAEELEWDSHEFVHFKDITQYCEVYHYTQQIDDYYSTKLMNADSEEEKQKILKDKENAFDKWEKWKDTQKVK